MPSRRVLLALPALLVLVALVALAVPALAGGPADEARAAAAAKDWATAADRWWAVIGKQADDAEAAVGFARAVVEGALVDRYADAEDVLQRRLGAKADDRDARLALGDLFLASGRAKSDQQAMRFTFEDARTQFQTLMDADPKDELAVAGLARAHYWMGGFEDALKVLDAFLAEGKTQGPAPYWKGQIHYRQALDAFAAAGNTVDDATRSLFTQAHEAYGAATQADPALLDAWLQAGYCAQYLGQTDAALQAYEKAMDLDPQGTLPLKGIEALYFHRQAEYLAALKDLARRHPTNVAVYFFLGFRQMIEKQFDGAALDFQTWQTRGKNKDAAWTWLAQAYEGAEKPAEAAQAAEKALSANEDDEAAAGVLDRQILKEHGPAAAKGPKEALAAAKAYEKLLALAPRNPWIRNNIAFLLRDAADKNKGDAAWAPVVAECARLYEDASRVADDQVRGREATLPFARRHGYAGVFNDTGLMFQYYPAIEDLEKAEGYYVRALQLTDDGYGDAFANLVQVYLKQGRWQEAYDLSRDCADALKNADGTPHPNQALAREVMEKLVKEGKARGD